ncbi:MAG TPA: CPBP family glutamic-type intramembrane protease [Patescibacteria group bacterium]|nr:CPBP family glutamic-type intramembrane protease [Patescibacteria group bacterium]
MHLATHIRKHYEWYLILVAFFALTLYRFTTHFPTWFDEVVFKALVFGLPVWKVTRMRRLSHATLGFDVKTFWPGMFTGLAVGGCFGFLALIVASTGHTHFFTPGIFQTAKFWELFGLAFATAWWESLFFFSFVLTFLTRHLKDEWQAVGYMSLLFVLFHAPLQIVSVGVSASIMPLLLLACFAFGQGVLFLRTKSINAIILSHAFWGMTILVASLR